MESMSKKLTQRSGVMTSSSSKNGYDGAFFSGEAAEKRFAPPEDYSEIFSSGSSIPVLHLDDDTQNLLSLKLDYQNIFGGFVEGLGVPYQELVKTTQKCSHHVFRNHSAKESPLQGADTCNLSLNSEEHPSEVSDPSLDAMKQFNMSYLKTSQGNKTQPNGITHVAKLHAVPGFTYFVNEPPSKQKTESGMPIPPVISEVHRTWSFNANIPDENNRKTEMLLPSKPNAEGVSGGTGRSQSKDESLNGRDSYLKSQSFKHAPSSNHSLGSHGIRGHPDRSKSSYISSKANPFERSIDNGTDGSSDEELYINSDAAACAASLKRVLEKAQESIRLAKEIRERGENGGLQRFSNLSSEYCSKANDKKKHIFNQEVNSSKKQNVKDKSERLGSECQESDERNRRLGFRTTGVSTASKCNQEPVTSTEAATGKCPLHITDVDGNSKHFLEVIDATKSNGSTLASDQVEMDKNTSSQLMREQEILASPSMEKQEIVIGETTISETTEQIENNVETGKSIEKDFGMRNAENNLHVDEQTPVSEVTANSSDSAPVKHEVRTNVGLETSEKDARCKDMNCILDELRHCEIKFSEFPETSKGKIPEPSKIEYQHTLNESQNLAEEEEQHLANCEPQEVQLSHKDKEKGLYSCNEEHMVQKQASGFVVNDDAPEVCSSGGAERTHKDSQDDEACGTSNGLESCNVGGMVQQGDCVFVASDDAPEVCGSGNWKRKLKNDQEGEACGTSNAIHKIGVEDSDLISEHKREEAPMLPYEKLKKEVVEDLDLTEKKLVRVPHEEKSKKVLKEEHWKEEGHERSEETYNQLKVDWNTFGEELDWGEVGERSKKGCIIEDTENLWSETYNISACQNAVEIIQETEENTFVHIENAHFDHVQIDLLQKDAHQKNLDPDAYVSLHDVQEAHSRAVVDDHESSNSTTGTSEDFYNCEWEGNSEEVLKECEFDKIKLNDKGDCAQCPFEDVVSSTETPFSMAVESDGNETNADHDSLIWGHKLPQENVIKTTNFIQNAEKDNDIRFKAQDVSENDNATNQGTVTNKDVKEPEPSLSPEGEFLYRFREKAEYVHDEFSFDKEDEALDPKVVCKLESKEKEIDETQSSAVTHQATVTQESVDELITGQNIQFVRTKPQKNALPEDNEVTEISQKDFEEKEHSRKIQAMKRERERDRDRIAVERAIREARERAFAEVQKRMMAEAQDKLEKSSAETNLPDKASIEAKRRAERAAVERATAEARQRAIEKALSQNSTAKEQVQTDRLSDTAKDSALKHSFSTSDLESFDGNNNESAQRRQARLERHERIMERAAKALADKNLRDLQAQKEQAERNRLAESLDADVKRWASGKERNLRALLSTLQYILGPESGWQPVSLTEIVTTAAVKKAYRKATLYVHPDKLQQRGASIQQKYICEKVFYLLKAAWSKFNSEER